jgi:hypothetical protein
MRWDGRVISRSHVWDDPAITSVLMCGTNCGVIVAYNIHSSDGLLRCVRPHAIIVGHSSRVASMCQCDPSIYRLCVASLSVDGTLSVISVEDSTVVLNQVGLFSENSHSVAAHEHNNRLILAAQAFGTIEVADAVEGTLILKISGFASIINGVHSHGQLHSVSCVDGSLALFSINHGGAGCVCTARWSAAFSRSILSPDLSYVLTIADRRWQLWDSDAILFERATPTPSDSFVAGHWISKYRFWVATLGGRVEVWDADSAAIDITRRTTCIPARYRVSGFYESQIIESSIVTAPPSDLPVVHDPPTFVFGNDQAAEFGAPVAVTVEGFVVTSPGPSELLVTNAHSAFRCHLETYFRSKYRGRCAIGDPIRHEARIGAGGEIYVDQQAIGDHLGVFRLYSPPVSEDVFFTFSEDGSVKAWDLTKQRRFFYDLAEPVSKVMWIEERSWIIVIDTESSFSVIDPKMMKSLLVANCHHSPIIDVTYANGLLHARCESTIYSWNIDGQLVSRRNLKQLKRLGQMNHLSDIESRSEPALREKSLETDFPTFCRVVPLIMPNCQTFAVVLNVFYFVQAFADYTKLPIKTNPAFLSLLLL